MQPNTAFDSPYAVRPGLLRSNRGWPRPDFAGSRRCVPGSTSIYVIDPFGYRRWIPSDRTYNRLFRTWDGIVDDFDLDQIAEGAELSPGAMLVRGDTSSVVYLMDHGTKSLIVPARAMGKYGFNDARVFVVRQYLIDRIPNGPPWS
jgi:hypothetical protein